MAKRDRFFHLFITFLILTFGSIANAEVEEILLFDGYAPHPLYSFVQKEVYRNYGEPDEGKVTFSNPTQVYRMIGKAISDVHASHRVIALSDGYDNIWFPVAFEISQNFGSDLLQLSIQSDFDIPVDAELPLYHLDNTRDEDFSSLVERSIAPFDVIIMQRGLCLCNWQTEVSIELQGIKTCGGVGAFDKGESIHFLKNVLSIFNGNNEHAFIIMTNYSGFESDTAIAKELNFWRNVAAEVSNSPAWNPLLKFRILTMPYGYGFQKMFRGIYIGS